LNKNDDWFLLVGIAETTTIALNVEKERKQSKTWTMQFTVDLFEEVLDWRNGKMVEPKVDCDRLCTIATPPPVPNPKEYVSGRSRSCHDDTEKTNALLNSTPNGGCTAKKPGVGGEFVVTETETTPSW